MEGLLATNNPLAAWGLGLTRMPLALDPVGGSRDKGLDEILDGGLNLEVVLSDSVLVVVEVGRGDLVEAEEINLVGRGCGRILGLILFLKSSFRLLCSFFTSIFFSFSSLSVFPKCNENLFRVCRIEYKKNITSSNILLFM